MHDIIVKFISDGEKKQLEQLYTQTIQDEFHHYSQKLKDYYAFSEYKNRMLQLDILIGAFDGDTLVGFLMTNKPIGGVIYAHWIGVKKQYQKQGVGKKLLEFLEQYAGEQQVHNIHLEAAEGQKGYYMKQGYIEFGYDEKGYFGLSHYHLKKILQEPQEETFLK